MFADLQREGIARLPFDVGICEPLVEVATVLRIEAGLDVNGELMEKLRLHAEPHPSDIPIAVRSLVRIDGRVFVLKPSAEENALNGLVLVVAVPLGKLPDIIEG